jgi:hypothetical protein
VRPRGRWIVLTVPLLLASCTTPADPALGTWELNVAKSRYSPGLPPKSQTRTFEAAGTGLRTVIDGINSVGTPTHVEYTASYDGKDYPITGTPAGDTISLKRIDGRTVASVQKKAGRVTVETTRVVSEDGRTLTLTVTGTDLNGDALHNVLVFDRKSP